MKRLAGVLVLNIEYLSVKQPLKKYRRTSALKQNHKGMIQLVRGQNFPEK